MTDRSDFDPRPLVDALSASPLRKLLRPALVPALAAVLSAAALPSASSGQAAEPGSLGSLGSPGATVRLNGPVVAVDGDTLSAGPVRLRLWGVDTFEADQDCLDAAGDRYPCGRMAAVALESVLAAAPGPLACVVVDADRYGRLVARCAVGGVDIAEVLVRLGWALVDRRYADDPALLAAQDAAKAAGAGAWAGAFVPPWDWRRGDRL